MVKAISKYHRNRVRRQAEHSIRMAMASSGLFASYEDAHNYLKSTYPHWQATTVRATGPTPGEMLAALEASHQLALRGEP